MKPYEGRRLFGAGFHQVEMEGMDFCGNSFEFLFCLKVAFVGLGCWFIKCGCVSKGFGLDFVVVKRRVVTTFKKDLARKRLV